MKKNYLHTTILKFLLEKHKEELDELENEDTNQPDEDVVDEIDNEMKKKEKLREIKPDEDPEDTNLDEVIKEYFRQQEKRNKRK